MGTVSTAELLTAIPEEVYTISKVVTLTEGNKSNTINGATISGTSHADFIENTGLLVSISGNADNDTIDNKASFATINGGAGKDYIENWDSNVTILSGTGDDRISLMSGSQNNYVRYTLGDGNDTVWGMTENDTLNLPEYAELNLASSKLTSLSNAQDDLIIRVRTNGVITGEVRIVGGIKHPPKFTFGESNTESGSIGNDSGSQTGNGGNNGGSSSGSGGGRGGNGGGNTSGGKSTSEGRNSDASGSKSAVGVAGNDFLKAYAASTAGIIDGRGLGGFEVINGSSGADAIFAGDGGSQLWGGADSVSDTLIGGRGTDIFIVSKYQGSDLIANADSKDVVHLIDATLDDIIATEENNGAIAVAFNTGNVAAVQSSEVLSATFLLADGQAYRYDHVNKSWQGA